MEPYVLVGVVRADIGAHGAFKYHSRESVLKDLQVTYIARDGRKTGLVIEENMGEEASMLLEAMKPMLKAAMGRMGRASISTSTRTAPPTAKESFRRTRRAS